MEKKKSFFERRPYVCYALYAGLLFAFNLFLRCLLYTSPSPRD